MDSVQTSDQNEQGVSAKTSDFVEDNQDDLEETSHRLLFGGDTAPATESNSVLITAGDGRVGGSVQRTRDTSDLNLVAISGIVSAAAKVDVQPITQATNYETNPLPAIAKTGTAATVPLQGPTAEYAVPSVRRSGSTDSVAIKLTDDSAPIPLVPADVRLTQLDPIARHTVASASVNGLFERLGQPVPAAGRDANALPVVTAAGTVRRAVDQNMVKVTENVATTVAEPPAYRPYSGTRAPAGTRDEQQTQPVGQALVGKGLGAGISAVTELTGTAYGARPRNGGEPQPLSEGPARPRAVAASPHNADSAIVRVSGSPAVEGLANAAGTLLNGRPRTVDTTNSTHEIAPSARPSARVTTDGVSGLAASGAQAAGDMVLPPSRKSPNGADQAFISSSPLPLDTKGYPNQDGSVRVARTVDSYPGVPTPQFAPSVLPTRHARSQGEQTADVSSPTTARTGDTSRGLGLLAPFAADRVAPVSTGDRNLSVVRAANTNGDAPAGSPLGSIAGRDMRQTLINMVTSQGEQIATTVARAGAVDRIATNLDIPLPGGATRREMQTPAQVAANAPVIGEGGKIFVPATRTAIDNVSTNAPLPAARPDGTTVRPADGARVADVGTTLTSGVNRLVNGIQDIANPTTVRQETGLPRGEQPRGEQPAGTGIATGVRHNGQQPRVADAITNPGNPVPGRNGEALPAGKNLDGTVAPGAVIADKAGRSLEPALGADKGGIKTVDSATAAGSSLPATRGEAIRNGEQIARGTDIAKAGETTAHIHRNGEVVARAGETNIRGNENVRTADGATKVGGESVVRKDDVVVKSAEATVKSGEINVKLADVKSAEGSLKVADFGNKATENVKETAARSIDAQIKVASDVAIVSGKQIEVAAKGGSEAVAALKVQDGAVRLSNDVVVKAGDALVRGNEQSAIVRGQDVAANSQMVAADKNVRLADAIVKAADQAVKVDVIQPAKLDGIVRVSEQNIQNANPMLAGKIDAVRNEANSGARIGEQNQVIAQNQNQALNGRANEQVIAQGLKVAADNVVPGQRSPINNIDNVKVDQVVADILNHVRHNSKDQQAGAKILSMLDQSNNAANQQFDARVLLDAAAVRRILDGQGISVNPAILNTIMEGIRPTGEHAVDYALPSIGSLNLSQIISLGERLQEAVAGAGSETSEPQSKPQLQQHRTKYFVKDGDTLETIAQEKLGDSRLVQLLITINRALVNYRLEGERKVAYVVPNQYLWLPTDHELDIHKKNFFGKQGKDGSVSLGICSKQNTPLIPAVSFDRTMEVSAEVSASMEDFRPASSSSNPVSGNRMSAGYEVKKYVPSFGSASGSRSGSISGAAKDSANGAVSDANKMAGNLDKVRHAGDRKSVNLDEIDYISTQVSHRQCYQVREGETLMSIAASLESMGHISMWKLLAKINGFQTEEGGLGKSLENLFAGQFIVLPTTDELNEYRLLEKLSSCTNSTPVVAFPATNAFSCVMEHKQIETPPPPALVAMAQGVGGLTTVHKLSSFTRLVLTDLPQLVNCFSITVEARWNGQWKPMASYECRHGQTTRHLYNKHGEIKSMELDLPPFVVKEMAREDFIRNWNGYVNNFMGEATERFVQS